MTENSESEVANPQADQPVRDTSAETKPGLPKPSLPKPGLPKLSEVLEALSKVVRKPRPRP